MNKTQVAIEVDGGVLDAHYGGVGIPALLLHGGPGLPDYMEGCAAELGRLFTTIRYTQRGVAPSTAGPPYSVESHMADALAVLDTFGLEQAWAVGHSWGGHLALHLAVAYPERLHGVVCIDALGASLDVLPEFEQALRSHLSDAEQARYDEVEARSEAGEATSEELVEQFDLVWPYYFFDPATAPPQLTHVLGAECSRETFESVKRHAESGTLRNGLPEVQLPVLFAHGVNDPLPIRSAVETAKLIPGAKLGRIPRCGHYPWLEQPGFLDRMLRGLISEF
jgi:pimeloyl-ACP methyl ester carboxylesterase